ncbi:DUF2254 family protein [Rhodococcus sp. GXMU-t2271]|uniref:DUF2254 family protein n=1 Tax=Rhodococcus sp. GXMU-t2271 TaxID=3059079 RepID=UPI00352AD6F5
MTVPAVRDGWVTQAPTEHLLASVPPSTMVRLETRPGAYTHRGEVLLRVWPVPDSADRLRRRLESAVEISDTRTMQLRSTSGSPWPPSRGTTPRTSPGSGRGRVAGRPGRTRGGPSRRA